jgi:hypothetical protein
MMAGTWHVTVAVMMAGKSIGENKTMLDAQ